MQSMLSLSLSLGCISSQDDFYQINGKLVVTETTLGMLLLRVYENVPPPEEQIFDFMRIMTANRLSSTGEEWEKWITFVHTGTYNSHWMILDLEAFEQSRGQTSLSPGVLTILETVPDDYYSMDATEMLEQVPNLDIQSIA
eukprot:TRINITY_DN2985_c0_g1_i4.p1 TRINITY_DN2985_c0_g1~~TRINITY_DN2985_c0_g1_i4.p1  ORF type:complete len:141 (-),score=32.22 TRINITY_DN2985_c0_g1_i4:281-703(-)